MEPAPISSWSPSPRSTDSSPATFGLKRQRENGEEPEPEIEPAPKKAFGFEMKLSSNLVRRTEMSCFGSHLGSTVKAEEKKTEFRLFCPVE